MYFQQFKLKLGRYRYLLSPTSFKKFPRLRLVDNKGFLTTRSVQYPLYLFSRKNNKVTGTCVLLARRDSKKACNKVCEENRRGENRNYLYKYVYNFELDFQIAIKPSHLILPT